MRLGESGAYHDRYWTDANFARWRLEEIAARPG